MGSKLTQPRDHLLADPCITKQIDSSDVCYFYLLEVTVGDILTYVPPIKSPDSAVVDVETLSQINIVFLGRRLMSTDRSRE